MPSLFEVLNDSLFSLSAELPLLAEPDLIEAGLVLESAAEPKHSPRTPPFLAPPPAFAFPPPPSPPVSVKAEPADDWSSAASASPGSCGSPGSPRSPKREFDAAGFDRKYPNSKPSPYAASLYPLPSGRIRQRRIDFANQITNFLAQVFLFKN